MRSPYHLESSPDSRAGIVSVAVYRWKLLVQSALTPLVMPHAVVGRGLQAERFVNALVAAFPEMHEMVTAAAALKQEDLEYMCREAFKDLGELKKGFSRADKATLSKMVATHGVNPAGMKKDEMYELLKVLDPTLGRQKSEIPGLSSMNRDLLEKEARKHGIDPRPLSVKQLRLQLSGWSAQQVLDKQGITPVPKSSSTASNRVKPKRTARPIVPTAGTAASTSGQTSPLQDPAVSCHVCGNPMSVFTSPGSGGPTLVCTDTCTMHGFSLAGALQEELQNDVTMVEFPDNGPRLFLRHSADSCIGCTWPEHCRRTQTSESRG